MADPILNGKPMKLCKNGSDMISFFFLSSFVCVYSSLKLLQQHFALPASRCLICFWGSPDRRLLQKPSFDKIRQTAVLLAALQVMYGRTLLGDLMWKKQDLTTAETCCSMESSASKVTPKVFTTVENGMDASPTEKQSTGTVSVLGDVPQRCTSRLLHLASVWFSLSVFESGDSKTQYFLSHSAQAQVQLVGMGIARNLSNYV